jgi:DNA topoisomerase-1
MKILLIVESPSKCAKIESFIQCRCISSKGHIRELKKLPEPGKEPVYEFIPEKVKHIESMKKVIKEYSADKIYVATDDDREGEAIAWHICQVFGLTVETTKRIIFHEVTKPALERAVLSPGVINMNLVRAQQTRQVLDLMVGFKVSPVLWKYLYMSRGNSLSAGRCQTPALRLVYDNAKVEVKITQTYKITGLFYPKKLEFELSKELETREETREFLEASKGFRHIFSMGVKKEIVSGAPKPFNTSSLLQAASSGLRMSPKEVMSGCQQLYQEGYITYMRTESQLYCAEYLGEVAQYIRANWHKEAYLGDLGVLENRDAGNPHEAIRVTHLEVVSLEASSSTKVGKGITGRVAKLYQLIWRNSVASCMSACRMEQTALYLSSPLENVRYVHKVEVPIFWGWRAVENGTDTATLASAGAAIILYVSQSAKEQMANRINAKVAVHGRRTHYTEASLIKKLEDIGIGRPSTYASLVDTIIERGYVKKEDIEGDIIACSEFVLENGGITETQLEKRVGQEKGKLVIQPVGILVAEFLTENFGDLFDYEYTKVMESNLDEMATSVTYSKDLCGECATEIERLIQPVEKRKFVLKDTSDHIVVLGRFGPMIQKIGSREFISVRKDIDMGKLKSGDYSLAELTAVNDANEIGVFEGETAVLKTGPFGLYICHKGKNIGLKTLGLDKGASHEEIYESFMTHVGRGSGEEQSGEERSGEGGSSKMIRELTECLSIRNGKYGAYIHYHKPEMKKPQFFKLKGFKESYRLCHKEVILEWIQKTYNVG